jgi:hypothetical protein
VLFRLTKLAWLVASARENAVEAPSTLGATPVTCALALPGGDTDAAAVAKAIPGVNDREVNVEPGKKKYSCRMVTAQEPTPMLG